MKSCAAASDVLDGMLLFNWTQDAVQKFTIASCESKEHAERGVRLVRELLAQFSEEDELYRLNLRVSLGDLLFDADRDEEGAAVFLELMRELPSSAIGYVRLADHMSDPERVIALLEEAKAKTSDHEKWDVEERLDTLRTAFPAVAPAKP